MLGIEQDGRLQATAGATVLHRSRIVYWNSQKLEFVPVPRDTFERTWKMEIDPTFGRLICWIQFSAGMELWLKGLCLLHGIELRKEVEVPVYPDGDIDEWAKNFSRNWKSKGTTWIPTYGTLGSLTWREGKSPSLLDELLARAKANEGEKKLLISACQLLARSIRNRDAHGYIPNVRDSHYHLVPVLFSRCLNFTAGWLEGGASTLAEWLGNSNQCIAEI